MIISTCCVYPNSLLQSEPPLHKCNNLTDLGHPCELPDLWLPNSPNLSPLQYKILQHNSATSLSILTAIFLVNLDLRTEMQGVN